MSGDGLDIPGVRVSRVDHVPEVIEGAVRVGPHSTAKPGMLLRVVAGVGRFLVTGGESIEYRPEPGADPAAVEAMLQGGVLGALLHQRGDLPLHATTLVSPDRRRAVALAGHSGAGKSTTAYALIRRGWMLVSDDLTRVTIEQGKAVAWPGRDRIRLMEDACERFGIDKAALAPVPNWPGKFLIEVSRCDRPVRLDALVALERGEGRFGLDRLQGGGAVQLLLEHTYRGHYVDALGQAKRRFELVAAAAASVTVLATRGRASVEEVAASIESGSESG
ncbi:MAG TPA: hypothetical protein VF619_12420 [Allosphingosinicella sp.]|jgi:hypothetical protein